MIRNILVVLLLLVVSSCDSARDEYVFIEVEEYKSKVYASWIGQIIGNTYGLSYEFRFIEEPGPDEFPYGYGWTLDHVQKYNGAFSDDDTDIEYMYLTQMEEHGIEPSYAQLRDAWMSHVKERVWAANRQALTLMHAGHYPPVTGNWQYNTQFTQIDPQLVNEIWAVTAPGMIDYAVEKSLHAARITNDSFGVEPTLVYAAMYSAAFFENDIFKIIKIGQSVLSEDDDFYAVMDRVEELYKMHPDDWKASWDEIKKEYYIGGVQNKSAWKPIDAILNGALGIMALYYGEGDFQKTLDYSCAFGMDADNQAATMAGLIGIMNGLDNIPESLLYPLPDAGWEKPFNDSYKMVTREILTDASITDMADRIALQGQLIILAKGGEIVEIDGNPHYKIPTSAKYSAPFEFNPIPELHTFVGAEIEYPLYTGQEGTYTITGYEDALSINEENKLVVNSNTPQLIETEITFSNANYDVSIPITVHIHTDELSQSATRKIGTSGFSDWVSLDTFKGNASNKPTLDYYGYEWDESQTISVINYNNGLPDEFGGWFTSFGVEYLDDDSQWVKADIKNIYPEMNLDNNQWLKPHFMSYHITIEPVITKGIRIIGKTGGVREDGKPADTPINFYTTIGLLNVFEK